jgi:hypothetical protein
VPRRELRESRAKSTRRAYWKCLVKLASGQRCCDALHDLSPSSGLYKLHQRTQLVAYCLAKNFLVVTHVAMVNSDTAPFLARNFRGTPTFVQFLRGVRSCRAAVSNLLCPLASYIFEMYSTCAKRCLCPLWLEHIMSWH